MKKRISPLNALASSSLVALALATGASTALADNPFAATSLDAGYQVADHHKSKEAKCGEGKCGGEADHKSAEGKCGEGKCGAEEGKKAAEGKCGEGKCGADHKAKEAKCGEGKCGSAA